MGDAHEEEMLHKQHGDYVEQQDDEEEIEEQHHEDYMQEEQEDYQQDENDDEGAEEDYEQEGQYNENDDGSSGQASANLGSSPESSDNEEEANTMSFSKNKQTKKQNNNREVEMTNQMKDRSLVQRDSSVQKRNVPSKTNKKKKNQGSDSDDSNDERADEIDEDEDDDDIDEYSYDSEEEERRRKIREQYDIQDTCMKWIGFFVGVVIISLLIWLMNSTSSSYNKPTTKQDKQIPLEPQTNYPFDIMFQNLEYKNVKDQSDRTKAAQCNGDELYDFYQFELPMRYDDSNGNQQSVRYISSVDNKCTSACNSFPIHSNNTADGNNLSYEQIIQQYSCVNKTESSQAVNDDLPVFSNGKCTSCSQNCHRCSMFSGYCNGCYSGFTLFNKTCVKKCPFSSIVEEFCLQNNPQYEQRLNLSLYSANDFQLYLIHKPPMIVIPPQEKSNTAIESTNNSDNETGLTPEELNSNELVVEKSKNNSTITTPSAFTMPKITQYKKYPLIILLNDWRYTQEDLFTVPAIAKYLDKAFILSMPFLQPQLSSKDLHQLIVDEVKEMLKNEQQAIEFYAIVGLGATGQLAGEIALNQADERRHWEARFLINLGLSEKNLTMFITQENRFFEESIKNKDTYFQDKQFCRLESRQKQIASIALEVPESAITPLQKLDFYIEKSFAEIFHHYEAKKLSINQF